MEEIAKAYKAQVQVLNTLNAGLSRECWEGILGLLKQPLAIVCVNQLLVIPKHKVIRVSVFVVAITQLLGSLVLVFS